MEPGIYDNITNHDYHKGPGISKSGLDLIAQSPAHYYHAVNAANDNEPTAAQAFGTAFHTLLLEPEVFAATYVSELRKDEYPDAIDDREKLVEMVRVLNESRLPKLSLTGAKAELINRICDNSSQYVPADLEKSKADELKYILEEMNKGRTGLLSTTGSMNELAAILRQNGHDLRLMSEIKLAWAVNVEGKTVLTMDQWDQLHAMRDAVMAHPAASYLMKLPGKAEQSVYWNDPKTGVLCRCRPDWWTQSNIVVDLKTCIDASPEGFAKSIYNWRYHVQDEMYRDGIKIATGNEPQFVFLAVEKGACVVNGVSKGVAVYQLDLLSREAGALLYRANLGTYAQCSESGKWPGYHNFVQEIAIPAWGLRDVAVE